MTNDIAITEWDTEGKFVGTWKEASLEAALASVSAIKISGRGHKFTFENTGGTVVHAAIIKPLEKEVRQRQLGESH